MQSKIIHLVRHGQALHNVRAEPARTAGCSFDRFLDLMRQDEEIDNDLTPTGIEQATHVRETAASLTPQLILVSPLSRAIDTANIVFGHSSTTVPTVCLENLRERNGLLLNGQRRTLHYLQGKFPRINFEDITRGEDTLWLSFGAETLETAEACSKRAYDSLLYVATREEEEIAVVAHGGLFHQLTTGLPELIQCDEGTSKRFHNCELRTVKMSWTTKVDIDDAPVVFQLELMPKR